MDIGTAFSVGSSIASAFGGGKKRGPSLDDQIWAQRKLWSEQIPMMVQGAKKAGIHPLYALGVPPASSSFSIGDTSGPSTMERVASMGQGLSAAYQSYQPREQKAATQKMLGLQLENQELQNARLRSEIALMNAPGRAPGMAVSTALPGQADVVQVPKEIVGRDGSLELGVEAGSKRVKWAGEHEAVIPSSAMQTAMDADGPLAWYYALTRSVPTAMMADKKWLNDKAVQFVRSLTRKKSNR